MDDEGEVDEDSGSLMKVKLMKVKLMKTVDHCGRIRPRPRTGRLDRVERGEGGCLCATLSTLPYTRGCYFIYSIFLQGVILYTLLLHCYYRGCQAVLHLTVLLN